MLANQHTLSQASREISRQKQSDLNKNESVKLSYFDGFLSFFTDDYRLYINLSSADKNFIHKVDL